MATPRLLGMPLSTVSDWGCGGDSVSLRIGSCAQLLGVGQRLKLRIHGGDSHKDVRLCGSIFGSQA